MTGEQELVARLYRADWTRLSLSGQVRGADEPTFPAGPVTVLLGRGKRYREESPDGRLVRGCDGKRIWLWAADPPSAGETRLSGGPQPPFPLLLAPSWLFGGYELSIEGETTTCGRAGIRIVATPRRDVRERDVWLGRSRRSAPSGRSGRSGRDGWAELSRRGWPLIPPVRWSSLARYERADCVVDAQLGILLRCEGVHEDLPPEVTEFVQLTLDPDVSDEGFSPPEGSIVGDGSDSTWSFGGAGGGVGREAVRTAAGVAAGGLGAAIRYSRFFSKPRPAGVPDDDPDGAMPPDDDPVLGAPPTAETERDPWARAAAEAAAAGRTAGVTDEILHLLYRGGAGSPSFSGTLHRWFDLAALLEAVPDAARKTGFGGVGLLIDALRDVSHDLRPSPEHTVRSVRMGGWDEFRIDLTYQTPFAREHDRREPDGAEPGRSEPGRPEPGRPEADPEPDRPEPDRPEADPDGAEPGRSEPGRSEADPDGAGLDDSEPDPDGAGLDDSDAPRDEPVTVAGDGQRRWQVFADRVVVGPPGPPPDEILDLVDGSWLLGCDLSGGEEIVVGGRRAYRIRAADRHQPWFAPVALSEYYFPLAVVVDAESGLLLRTTWYKGGRQVSRHEFRDVAALGDGDFGFGFQVPAGLRVVTERAHSAGSQSAESGSAESGPTGSADPWWRQVEESPDPMAFIARSAADAVKKQVDEKAAAARAFLESLSGRKPPPPAG